MAKANLDEISQLVTHGDSSWQDAGMTASASPDKFADAISSVGQARRQVEIQISFDVVRLLSEQLYASPVKAIEELVVNGWDAGADNCSVLIDLHKEKVIAVFDDGAGMTLDQLGDLWHIGVSHKPPLERPRKQIGKFGIGKLASYAIARRATYITKSLDGLLAVTINFDDLAARTDARTGTVTPLPLEIRGLSVTELQEMPAFKAASSVLDLAPGKTVSLESEDDWTLVVLEDFRERAETLVSTGRLRWVLRTAMPRASDFDLYLNHERVSSEKEDFEEVVSFSVAELNAKRIEELRKGERGTEWKINGDSLVSDKFPIGVSGRVIVTRQSLYKAGGKSEDLGRSHGFFVRVHGRLINETDPLLGARPLSFATWYHFAADVEADDLNPYVTAARDDVEQSELKPILRDLLIALFYDARDRKDVKDREAEKAQIHKPENEREYVSRRHVEQPLADALVMASQDSNKESIEERWTLIDPIFDTAEIEDLVGKLYTEDGPRPSYRYRYAALGENEPFLSFSAKDSIITLNEDHILVREYSEKPESRRLLELFAAAEAMLEAYMHESGMAHEQIRELLTRRDLLLRALAQDESQSLRVIGAALRRTSIESTDSKAFEIAIVAALRSLGFSAVHVSGSGTPDGIADYQVYGHEGVKLTLEAKASKNTPSLGQIDLAGIRSHAEHNGAKGTLVVAPTYPGIDDPESEVNTRAVTQRASLWTADQLARVVESAENRHLTAKNLQDVVLNAFRTTDVAVQVDELISSPVFSRKDLYSAILEALKSLSRRIRDRPRTVDMIAAEVSRSPALETVSGKDILSACRDLASVSRGLLHVTEDESLVLLGDLEELHRRVSTLTDGDSEPRRRGTFRGR